MASKSQETFKSKLNDDPFFFFNQEGVDFLRELFPRDDEFGAAVKSSQERIVQELQLKRKAGSGPSVLTNDFGKVVGRNPDFGQFESIDTTAQRELGDTLKRSALNRTLEGFQPESSGNKFKIAGHDTGIGLGQLGLGVTTAIAGGALLGLGSGGVGAAQEGVLAGAINPATSTAAAGGSKVGLLSGIGKFFGGTSGIGKLAGSLGAQLLQNQQNKKAEQAQSDAIGAFIGENRAGAEKSAEAIRESTEKGVSTLQESESRVLKELEALRPFTEERNPFQDDINAELERQLGRQASSRGQFRSGATAEALTREIGAQERQDRTRRLNLLQQLTGNRAQTISGTQSSIANLQAGQGGNLANINQQLTQQLGQAQLSAGSAQASQAINRGNQISQLFGQIPFENIGDKLGGLLGRRKISSTQGVTNASLGAATGGAFGIRI